MSTPSADLSGEVPYVDVLVAGAGVVGMACARALQRSGYSVCVADPQPAGSLCSFGNAGVIATDHVLPMARPEMLRRVPAMLLSPRSPLYLKPGRVPGLAGWMLRFAAACRADRVAAGSRATAALTGAATDAWVEELDASAAAGLLCRRGMYSVYRSAAAYQRDAAERARQRDLGVAWEPLNGDELRQREPALSESYSHAVYYPEVAHVLSPQGLVQALADAFGRAGGVWRSGSVEDVRCEPHQVSARAGTGRMRARYLVLAAGLASRTLCAELGLRIPLAAEMGYHLTFPGGEALLRAPVAAAEDGFLVTPMGDHLRAAGTVEFARREMAPAWRRAEMLGDQTARLFRRPLPAAGGRWRGSRPTLPDFLPAIGALPGHPRVLAAFGHNHIGLTTAAITGRLIRDLVRGERPELDIAPYDPGRFTSPGLRRNPDREI